MSEYEFEPIKGLPYKLPQDERILWQGQPNWLALAKHLCHLRTITLYFAVLMAWRLVVTLADGGVVADALPAMAWLAALLGIVVGFLALFAYLVARTTIYTITTRRVVLRYGIAFTKAVNVPLRLVSAAALRLHGQDVGDLPLQLKGPDKIAYLILWPHARPWRFKRTEPMLRCVPDVQHVAQVLRAALLAKAAADVNAEDKAETVCCAPNPNERIEELDMPASVAA